MSGTDAGVHDAQYLTCLLGDRTLGLDILAVDEIVRDRPATPVPRAPRAVRGVINLRGSVLPVLDLAAYLGLPASTLPAGQRCIVIVRVAGARGPMALGLLVDAVSAVRRIAADAIEPVPEFGIGVRPEHLSGMVRTGESFVMLLDLARACAPSVIAAGRTTGASLRVAA